MTKVWLAPDLNAGVEPARRYRQYKVIRVYWTWARSKKDALKFVQEGTVEPEAEFAVEEQPQGWLGSLLKQILG